MKYVITWSLTTANYQSATSRFLETGAPAPAGVKLLGRWHSLEGSSRGFILAEASDAKGIYRWVAEWNELCSFTVTPVVEDADAAQVLQSLRK